jgi:hypothetical protein
MVTGVNKAIWLPNVIRLKFETATRNTHAVRASLLAEMRGSENSDNCSYWR